jgi:hypothetical protein
VRVTTDDLLECEVSGSVLHRGPWGRRAPLLMELGDDALPFVRQPLVDRRLSGTHTEAAEVKF